MARNNKQKKSLFSFLNFFKTKSKHKGEGETWDDSLKAYRVYPSDQDGARWVAQPGIDRKASAYINGQTNRWNHADYAQPGIDMQGAPLIGWSNGGDDMFRRVAQDVGVHSSSSRVH